MLKHISFGKGVKTLAILIPTKDLDEDLLLEYYVKPLEAQGIKKEQIVAFNLMQNDKGKVTAALVKSWLDTLKKSITHMGIQNVLVCDSAYFKTLVKVLKVTPHYGYVMPSIWKDVNAFLSLNYRALFYDPSSQSKIDMSIEAVSRHMNKLPGMFEEEILHDPFYPITDNVITNEITQLHTHQTLTCDIEAHSLKVWKAGIATISFAWDEHSGIAFEVGAYNETLRAALKRFFTDYKGTLIFHGSPYDCKVIIWELFMDHPRDYTGMIQGLHIMFRDLEDTKILAYLALNSTAQVSLKLKELAFAYTGNYAMDDIADISKIPLPKLLEYNLYDTVATWYVYNLYKSQVMDEQKFVYEEIFLPALKVITQMELCGIPVNLGQILSTKIRCDEIARTHMKAIMENPVIHIVTERLRDKEAIKANKKLKKLVKTRDDFLSFDFNPGSGKQVAFLLYNHLKLPILSKTDTGAPSTDGKTLNALLGHCKDEAQVSLLTHIIELADVQKILSTFIPAFENNSISKDGWAYLHGGFNLGGTKSGRLSSSDPNLTNIPSTGTQYAKPVKQCFQGSPPNNGDDGRLLVGADFFSLEDYISALQTRDPNKLKVYLDGYDGHCLRAFKYFGDQMPDIVDTVESINSIGDKYPKIRQASKSPTFLLTYMGTAHGLMKQFGFTQEEAEKIESDYHELYKVSDDWVDSQVRIASEVGYATLAFGLRLRTPILSQIIYNSDSMPYQAHKEKKTVGNAHGQSYGLLNTRAGNEFQQRVWDSQYATQIFPVIQIHDSLYYDIPNNLHALHWVNQNLIECMEWNELPELQHPTVKLGAQLEVYYPDWSNPIKIPNRISRIDLKQLLDIKTEEIRNNVLHT